MNWAEWWVTELEADPAYRETVTPLVLDLLAPAPGKLYLDAGCGEGSVARTVLAAGARVVGVDSSLDLLRKARQAIPVVACELPSLACIADSAFDGGFMSLVLEHVEDYRTALSEVARVVKPGGVFALVVNHPYFTAPDSAPVVDPEEETLWRPGSYLDRGWTDEPTGQGSVRFHHRPMADLLTGASEVGWDLRRLVELGATESQVERMPLLAGQRHIPRLLGVRWVRRGATMAG